MSAPVAASDGGSSVSAQCISAAIRKAAAPHPPDRRLIRTPTVQSMTGGPAQTSRYAPSRVRAATKRLAGAGQVSLGLHRRRCWLRTFELLASNGGARSPNPRMSPWWSREPCSFSPRPLTRDCVRGTIAMLFSPALVCGGGRNGDCFCPVCNGTRKYLRSFNELAPKVRSLGRSAECTGTNPRSCGNDVISPVASAQTSRHPRDGRNPPADARSW